MNIEEIAVALVAEGWTRSDNSKDGLEKPIHSFSKDRGDYKIRVYMSESQIGAGLQKDLGEIKVMGDRVAKITDRLYDVFVSVPNVTIDDVRNVIDLLLKNSRDSANMIEEILGESRKV